MQFKLNFQKIIIFCHFSIENVVAMATNDIHDELYPNFVCGNREIVFAPNLLQLIKETTSKYPV